MVWPLQAHTQLSRISQVDGSDQSDTAAATSGTKPVDPQTDRVWLSCRPVVVFNAVVLEGEAVADAGELWRRTGFLPPLWTGCPVL